MQYRCGGLQEKEYLDLIKPLDRAIEKLELQGFSHCLEGNLVWKKSFSEHLR